MTAIDPAYPKKRPGQKIVFVSGRFNVLHPGHVRLLKFAKDCGDYLIVAVKSDMLCGDEGVIPQEARLEALKLNKLVDEVQLWNEPIQDLIGRLRPDVVVKGWEFRGRENIEQNALDVYGGELILCSGDPWTTREPGFSQNPALSSIQSSEMLERFSQRKSIDAIRLREIVYNFKKLRVGVIGDLIVDEYISCEAIGMSREEPTLVVTPVGKSRYVGGAGIVALHCSRLGASTDFYTVTAPDEAGEFAEYRLSELGVSFNQVSDPHRKTLVKQRFRCGANSLLRVTHGSQNPIPEAHESKIFGIVSEKLSSYQALILSDFSYGVLTPSIATKLIAVARENGVFVSGDSQSSSQLGDLLKFRGCQLVTPTEYEARLALRNKDDGLAMIADEIGRTTESEFVFLKLGPDGLFIHQADVDGRRLEDDRLPALNSTAQDTSGAGDSMLVVATLAFLSGATVWEAGLLGSLAAAIQVGQIGNTPLTQELLLQGIDVIIKH